MADLKDALHELADRPRPVGRPAAEPADLWSRGVRRKRLRVAGAVVAVVAVVAAGAGVGALVHGRRDVAPVGGSQQIGLPSSIGVPDPGSPGTAEAGPVGPVAVLWQSTRDGHDGASFFGVSASSGTYRFLDLPRIAGPDDVALSPDGREVAYWTTGPVTGKDFHYSGQSGDMATVVGIARYDTVSGKTRFAGLAGAHGLDVEAIHWTDDDTVVFQFGRLRTAESSVGIAVWSWGPTGLPQKTPDAPQTEEWTSATAGRHVVEKGLRYAVLPAGATRASAATVLPRLPDVAWSDVTTDGTYVAGVQVGPSPDSYTGKGSLRVGRLRAGHPVTMRRMKDLHALGIVGWSGPGRLLVAAARNGVPNSAELKTVDLDSGVVHDVGTIRNRNRWPGVPQYATDLLTKPFVARAVPHWHDDRWDAAGWGALGAALLAGGFLLWRRRARG